jgi:NADH:ubiquinone oxidoreductase subunit 3 (subunit A)
MDRGEDTMIDIILNILLFIGGVIGFTLSFKVLLGLEKEHSERRKRYENGETDYYGNKIDD